MRRVNAVVAPARSSPDRSTPPTLTPGSTRPSRLASCASRAPPAMSRHSTNPTTNAMATRGHVRRPRLTRGVPSDVTASSMEVIASRMMRHGRPPRNGRIGRRRQSARLAARPSRAVRSRHDRRDHAAPVLRGRRRRRLACAGRRCRAATAARDRGPAARRTPRGFDGWRPRPRPSMAAPRGSSIAGCRPPLRPGPRQRRSGRSRRRRPTRPTS